MSAKIIKPNAKEPKSVPVMNVVLSESGQVGVTINDDLIASPVRLHIFLARVHSAIGNMYQSRNAKNVELATEEQVSKITGENIKIL